MRVFIPAAGLAVSQHLALDGVMGAFLAGDVWERDALSTPEVHGATSEKAAWKVPESTSCQ